MIRSPIPTLVLPLLVACGVARDDSATPPQGGAPDIQLLVSALDFGEVEVGVDPAGTYTFAIHNQGDASLHIQSFGIEDELAPFEMLDPGVPLIAPGSSSMVGLAFDPQLDGSWVTTLRIDSDDPDTPTASVTLEGRGLAPQIIVTPQTWEPDTTWVGCTQQMALNVWNTGGSGLTILDVDLTSATTETSMAPVEDDNGHAQGLVTVPPGQGTQLTTVNYTPTDELVDTAYLTITSDDPQRGQTIVSIEAHGAVYGSTTDSFVQREWSTADLVVAVDSSSSMKEELAQLPAALAGFTETLAEQGTDYRVAVVTADNGCVNGPDSWVDASLSRAQAEAVFDTMIEGGDSARANTDRAFMLLEAFLRETPSGGCNEGFVRGDAVLHVMGVSDVQEDSVQDWPYYVSLFHSYKASPADLVVDAMGGDHPSGCDSATAYTSMYEATVATGGEFISICDEDWGDGFGSLAALMAPGRRHFPLTALPVDDTIAVEVNGLSSTHWTYYAENNELFFAQDRTPEPGDTVEITYALQPEC